MGDSGGRVNSLIDLGHKTSTRMLFPAYSFWLEQNSSYCLSHRSLPFSLLLFFNSQTFIKVIHVGGLKPSRMERHNEK